MKRLLVLLLVLTSQTCLGCAIDPVATLHQLRTENPKSVVNRLWDAGGCEAAILDGLSSGKREWIQLAVALRPFTDAWSGESLTMAVGEAMQRAPSRVLPLVNSNGFDEGICVPSNFDDSPEGIRRDALAMRRAKPMFEAFLNTSLAEKAKVCLAAVNDVLRSQQDEP